MQLLNTITPSGMPPRKLLLKLGMPIMLIRNMNGIRGQANGTSLILRGFKRRVLDTEIATGSCTGKGAFIPCMDLQPSDTDCLSSCCSDDSLSGPPFQ